MNGLGLTQWVWSGKEGQNLGELLAALGYGENPGQCVPLDSAQISPPPTGRLLSRSLVGFLRHDAVGLGVLRWLFRLAPCC